MTFGPDSPVQVGVMPDNAAGVKRAILEYCEEKGIPFITEFSSAVHPEHFQNAYAMDALPEYGLPARESAAALVMEPVSSDVVNHGIAVSAIAEKVGAELADAEVPVIYIPTFPPDEQSQATMHLLQRSDVAAVNFSFVMWRRDLNGNVVPNHALNDLEAFVVVSAGNEGVDGNSGGYEQKHFHVPHLPPLAVSVGAMQSRADTGETELESYSARNAPDFLAPVQSGELVNWENDGQYGRASGTSSAAPFVTAGLTVLDKRYGKAASQEGAYLSREQILFAVMASCDPPAGFRNQITGLLNIPEMVANAAGHRNSAAPNSPDQYAGFGVVNFERANKLCAHMVAQAQQHPEQHTDSFPVNVEAEAIMRRNSNFDENRPHSCDFQVEEDGIAFKLTFGLEFNDAQTTNRRVTAISPSGTQIELMPSSQPNIVPGTTTHYSLATTHAFIGEELRGNWEIQSDVPLRRISLNAHAVGRGDLIAHFTAERVQQALEAPDPNLSSAQTREALMHPDLASRVSKFASRWSQIKSESRRSPTAS